MRDFLENLFSSDLMPHGRCWSWEPWVVWTNVGADAVIAVTYAVIACNLILLVARRKDVTFDWVVVMFGVFTFACGCTHAMEVYNTWHGVFRLAGVIKLITATASVMTMAFLLRITPKLLVAPTLDQALAMIDGQKASQAALRDLAAGLEDKVRAQTQELRESEARLQGFIRHSPAGIAFKGLDGRYLLINPSMEALIGRPSDEIIGHTTVEFFASPDCLPLLELEQRVLRQGRDLQTEQAWTDRHGVARQALTHVFPLVDTTGRCWGVGVMATDITERKEADRALLQSQKLESMGVLAGGIAHDFNNLLGAMQGNVELALTEVTLGAARSHLETLRVLMAKGSDLLRQMLTYAGRGKAVLETVDLNRQVKEMLQLLRASISKKAQIREDLHPGPLPLLADPSQIQQVVMNLVINASEALGDRNGAITLRTRMEEVGPDALAAGYDGQPLRPGPFVTLQVLDEGSGMTPEVLKRIFDPFFTTKFTGRGLGLAAIHGIVRGHRGGIRVTSEPGKGTCFKLLFPAASGPPVPIQPGPRLVPAGTGVPALQGTVLVVDDEDAMRDVAAKALGRLGLAVLQARDGREALDLFQRHRERIRLVVMDLTMPRMDGEESCRELRRLGADVPVILTSGFNEAEAMARFEGLGLAGFLKKPFSLGAFAELVRSLLAT